VTILTFVDPLGDYSANAIAIPLSGYTLLATIPVTAGRSFVEVQNQGPTQIQIVRDNGAGGSQTSILVGSGGIAGTQGGDWSSSTFKGRIRVYGPAGAVIGAYQE
jgi:hypothetical protein